MVYAVDAVARLEATMMDREQIYKDLSEPHAEGHAMWGLVIIVLLLLIGWRIL
jgi:hypothetical protein